MEFLPQQLNFALWCTRTGCSISREILTGKVLAGISQLRAFDLFHVYFTTRHILFEMGGMQRVMSLPGDPNFNQQEAKYDQASYENICAEFGVDPNSDFRFKHGHNKGLG